MSPPSSANLCSKVNVASGIETPSPPTYKLSRET